MAGLSVGAWILIVAPFLAGMGLVIPFYRAHRGEPVAGRGVAHGEQAR